jgi:hypothetical protein
MNRRILTLLMVTAVIFATLPVGVTVQESEGPPRTGLRPDAPPYGVRGPYWVGFADHHIEDNFERSLDASIWYPAVNPTESRSRSTTPCLIGTS